jgi:hypothetical protein
MTQLIEAAAAGSVHDVRQLLAGDEDVNCAGMGGNTALHAPIADIPPTLRNHLPTGPFYALTSRMEPQPILVRSGREIQQS